MTCGLYVRSDSWKSLLVHELIINKLVYSALVKPGRLCLNESTLPTHAKVRILEAQGSFQEELSLQFNNQPKTQTEL